jgi:MATE family multidrug resistance protein
MREDLAELARLAAPIIASRLLIMGMTVTDTVVVGNYGGDALAALMIGAAPASVLLMVLVGLLTGVQVMAARHAGAGELHRSGAVWRRGVAYGLMVGSLIAAAGALFARPLLLALGQEPALVERAAPVLVLLALSMPVHAVYVACAFFLEAMKRPIAGMVALLAANLLNIVLDIWLVFGGLGVPPQAEMGAVIVTLACRVLLAGALVAYVLHVDRSGTWRVWSRPPREPYAEAEQRQLGYAAGSSNMLETGAFAGMTIIAGLVSTLAVGAYTIGLNVLAVMFMVALGLAVANSVLVSRAVGAGQPGRARGLAWLGLGVTVIAMALLGLGAWALSGVLAAAHTAQADTALRAGAAGVIAILALAIVFDGAQASLAANLRALGDVWVPTASHFFAYLAVMVPVGWVLAVGQGMGAEGLAWAILASSVVSAVLLVVRLMVFRPPPAA